MNPSTPTGLGNPIFAGKRSLFQPPRPSVEQESSQPNNSHIRQKKKVVKPLVKRIRTTTELTPQALTVIQEIQQRHRLKTGKVLPVWKIISQAVEQHGQALGKMSQG